MLLTRIQCDLCFAEIVVTHRNNESQLDGHTLMLCHQPGSDPIYSHIAPRDYQTKWARHLCDTCYNALASHFHDVRSRTV